ncbi:hypothetical protein AAMO2058_001196300 [Amorphochlora amoebiformis]
MGYLLYSEMKSDAGQGVMTGVVIFSIVTLVCVCPLQIIDFSSSRTRKKCRKHMARFNLMKYTLLFYSWHMFAGVITGITFLILKDDIDKSQRTCDAIFSAGGALYAISKWVLYALLIAKSLIYDSMNQMRLLYNFTWWIVHGVYSGIVVYIVIAQLMWRRRFTEIEGDRVCIENISVYTQIIIMLLDLAISALCIVILAGPTLLGGNVSKKIKSVAKRNISAGVVASITTAANMLFLIFSTRSGGTAHGGTYIIVKFAMQVSTIDILINFICMTLCWPLRFYIKIFRRQVLGLHASTPRNRLEKGSHRNKSSRIDSGISSIEHASRRVPTGVLMDTKGYIPRIRTDSSAKERSRLEASQTRFQTPHGQRSPRCPSKTISLFDL